MHFHRISILGVGLLGGSIGMAVKAITNECQIVGYGHRRESLDRAMEFGAIDSMEKDLGRAVAGADLIILCTPVGTFARMMSEIAGAAMEGAVVTDVGSTKRSIVRLAEGSLPRTVHFVGSHPMAGSEKRGVEYARTDLFQNSLCILTPTPRTDTTALKRIEEFWEAIGMNTTHLSPDEHDRLLADISHLPHAMAAALVAMQAPEGLGLAGKGFLDTTRIASGDGHLWRDILLDNRDNLRESIRRLKQHLEKLENMLEAGKAEELAKWLDTSAGKRAEVLARKLRDVMPD